MSEKREKQTKSKRRIWRGVTTATASLLTLSMSATLVIDGFRTDIDKFLVTQSTKMVTEDVSAEDYTFQSDYSSTTELLDSIEDLGERMNEEGSVLLKNENAAFQGGNAENLFTWIQQLLSGTRGRFWKYSQ